MKTLVLNILFCVALIHIGLAQNIGDFKSLLPSVQDKNLHLPGTHTFQLLIQHLDSLNGDEVMPDNFDFTGFVPKSSKLTEGYLCINSELAVGAVAVLEIALEDSSQLWKIKEAGLVDFSPVVKTSRNCSGGITPKGTLITCEETQTTEDNNDDGIMDVGWTVEIDPATRQVMDQDGDGNPDKLYSMGRFQHENVAMTESMNIVYQGADHPSVGFVYKFIPNIPGNFSSGNLFVLKTTSDSTGVWVKIPNDTKNARNYTVNFSTSVGATNFNGVEDVEIGPDGKIYFTSKGKGVVYRFSDNGSSISDLEVYVGGRAYEIGEGENAVEENWGIGNDNLAFDGEGNLYVQQDGGKNFVWVVGKDHSQEKPDVRIFAKSPAGSEPTGITFSPDFKYMFLSFQHPYVSNSLSQSDASGKEVRFNKDATVVIARNEDLGRTVTPDLPVQYKLLNLFPVPAEEILTLQVASKENTEAEIRIFDNKGNEAAFFVRTLFKGVTVTDFDVAGLAPGRYFFTVKTDKVEETISFIKS